MRAEILTLALIVGLIVANTIQPGAGMNVDPATLDTGAVKTYVDKAQHSSIVDLRAKLGVRPALISRDDIHPPKIDPKSEIR